MLTAFGAAIRRVVRPGAAVTSLALTAAALVSVSSPAGADPAPVSQRTASTVTSDALPTAQIDGVAWSQVVVGNTVYVGGSFAKARPAGAASGASSEVARSNLLAYDITSGTLSTSFAPVLNGQVKSVAASPDGSRIYVGGAFTTVNGVTHNHVVAFNTSDGSVVSSFSPTVNSTVNAAVVTAQAVYVGGTFTSAGGSRSRLAAFSPTDGSLLAWAPTASDTVNALVVSPDGSRIIAGGRFTTVNSAAAYGLASISATDGSLLPWNANSVIQDAGQNAAITSLSTDGTAVYGTGYVYGSGGNFEGAFSADPNSGTVNWLEDCHGDTYGAFGVNGSVYTVSHAHYCGNIGGFPQTNPWTFHRTMAFTAAAGGTVKANSEGSYASFAGQPSPAVVNWFPDLTTGTYTGQTQAAWTVSGNSTYVVLGGEFPTVNGTAQQGLVRFAVKGTAPSKDGPRVSAAKFVPTIQARSTTSARISIPANWDRDDENLSYKIARNGALSKPIYTTTVTSQFWNRPSISYVDTGLTPGATYQYRVFATDPDGNVANGNTVSFTMPTIDPGPYFQDVLRDGASEYWRLGESSGSTSADYAASDDLTLGAGVTHSAAGAVSGDTADTFSGSSTGTAASTNLITGPNTFTLEAWFSTTTTSGGKIIGFGNAGAGGISNAYDRHVYMDNAGHLIFGVYNNAIFTAASTATYNDGQFHHVVATLSGAGMQLYVDGIRVGTNTATTAGQAYSGLWHVGGDNLDAWPSVPSSRFFAGTIDEAAVYPTALTTAQIDQHYTDSGRTVAIPLKPTDNYGATVYADSPDLYWRLDDTTGSTAADTSPNIVNGIYSGGETLGVPSPVSGGSGTAVTFDGSSGTIASTNRIAGPTVYSEEAWFSTTTTHGGKIIGFGDAQTGNSGNYDRHVYMLNNGQLVFGTYTGQLNLAQSTTSYNDGQWHHMVATQGPDGMTLYVDGQVVATNAQTAAQSYSGYWRVGGDSDWGGDSAYFAGTIDEVAVYSSELTAAQVLSHYKASPASVNRSPVASASVSCTYLTCAFDATSSKDPDGTISSYKWDFGDGSTGTGGTISHTYASAGNYPGTLTVTDNQGASGTQSGTVSPTAPPVNQPPAASFTRTCSYLKCAFDASASSDSDGSIASYAWDFGDGTTATGVAPVKAFASAGTYPVTLTVTDDRGAASTASASVTVVADQAPVASFTSTCTYLACSFDATASSDSDGSVASYAWSFGDGSSATGARVSHTFAAAGSDLVTLTVTDDQGVTGSSSTTVTVVANAAPVSRFTVSCTNLACSFDGSGSNDPDGTISTYAWDFGDGTTSAVQSPTHTFGAAGPQSVTLTVTDNGGASGASTTSFTVSAAANRPPTAAFTSTATNLTANFDGSTSSDPDGPIASYAWNFGDGSTGSGASVSHTYAGPGVFSVTLTVTDAQGATSTVVRSVTVNPGTIVASDGFGRTQNGWGTADAGGAWTLSTSSLFTDDGGQGTIALNTAGASPAAYLSTVKNSVGSWMVDAGLKQAATGNGVFVLLLARHVGKSEYRLKLRFVTGGTIQLAVSKVVNGTETTLQQVNVPGLTYTVGDMLRMRLVVSGTGTTTLTGKVWKVGTAEPAATQVSVSDSEATLQNPGSVGIQASLASNATTVPVTATVDNFAVYS